MDNEQLKRRKMAKEIEKSVNYYWGVQEASESLA